MCAYVYACISLHALVHAGVYSDWRGKIPRRDFQMVVNHLICILGTKPSLSVRVRDTSSNWAISPVLILDALSLKLWKNSLGH